MIPFFASGGRVLRQVTFISAGAGSTGAVAYPSSIAVGDVIILHQVAGDTGGAPTINTPSGFTAVTSTTASLYSSRVFRKIADGTETGSVTASITGDDVGRAGRMYRFSQGAGTESASSAAAATSATAMDAVNVTSTVDLALACQCFAATVNSTIGAISGESGGDYTEAVAEYAVTSGTGFCLSLQIATLAAAGSITGGSATLGASASARMRHGFVIHS